MIAIASKLLLTSLFILSTAGICKAGTTVSATIGSNTAGAATGFAKWGVHTTCPDASLAGVATCNTNTGIGWFETGNFVHQFFFQVPALPTIGFDGDVSAAANTLTMAVNASGTVSLYRDLGTISTAETSGPDVFVQSFTFNSGVTPAIALLQTMNFQNLVSGGHYFYQISGFSSGGTNANNYQINSSLYPAVSPIPEPSEWLMLLAGLVTVVTATKIRQKKKFPIK